MKFTNCIALVKPAKLSKAEIVHDEPSPLERIRGAIHGQPLTRKKYCRLLVNGHPMMTDAEFERQTNIVPCLNAKGDALIGGLGIGLILQPFTEKCTSVTVIEKESEVIDLVAKAFPKVTVIHADVFDWLPARKAKLFDTIYFDIWPEINGDDLEQAKDLHRKFRPYLRKGGYMESWCRIALKHIR